MSQNLQPPQNTSCKNWLPTSTKYEEILPFQNQSLIIKLRVLHLNLLKPNSTNLTLFLKQIKDPLHNYQDPYHTTRPNITSKQRPTLTELSYNSDLVITFFRKSVAKLAQYVSWTTFSMSIRLRNTYATPSHIRNSIPTQLDPSIMISLPPKTMKPDTI